MNYEIIKELRDYYDKTQQEMANILNVGRSTYAGWENGIDSIPLLKLNELCNYYEISLDYICGLTNNKKVNKNKNGIDMVNIGIKLKEIRTLNKDTQDTTAKAISIDQSTYSRYEQGQTMITVYQLIEFAKHYNVSIDYICNKSKNPEI